MNVRISNNLAIRRRMTQPDRHARVGRPTPPADTSTPGGRLRVLREGSRMGQEALAAALSVGRPQISKYENNAHAMPDYMVERTAQLFSVSPAYLRYGDTQSRLAVVRGRVGAGALVEAIEQPPWRRVEVPASWDDALALEISGLSCWPIYDDKDVIVARGEQRLNEGEFLGRMCVAETADGHGLIKRVRKGSSEGRYNLESPNAPTMENVALISARPVRLHLPN